MIGVAIMVFLTIFVFYFGKKLWSTYDKVSKDNDARVSAVNEVIFIH